MLFRIAPLRHYLLPRSLGAITSNTTLMIKPCGQIRTALTQSGQLPARGFTREGLKHHYAVLPLVFLIGGTVIGLLGFIVYSSQTRDNVVFIKSKKTPGQSVDLLNPEPLKIRVINQQYRPMAELDAMYKDMYKTEEK